VAPLLQLVPDPVIAATVGGAEQMLGRLAALSDTVPDRHLELLMRTPARRLVVESIFLVMPLYLDHTPAAGLETTIRWRVTGAEPDDDPDVYDLVIAQRGSQVRRAEPSARPLVTITIPPLELVRLATGRSSLMQAYLSGRLSLRGDIVQVLRLASQLGAPQGSRRATS
jgi:hypothetical protein